MCIDPPLPREMPAARPVKLGHDHIGINAISQHMAMVAIAGNDAIPLPIQRGLQADGDRFLPDIKVAEPTDQAEAIELPSLFFETGGSAACR